MQRHRSRAALLFLGGIALLSIVAVLPSHGAGVDAGGKVLAKLDDAWSAAAATKDTDKVASYYADDATVYPPDAPMVQGRAAARGVWASYFAAPNFSIAWKTTSAGVAKSGDLGFTAGTYQDSYTGADGKTVNETGKYVCVWRKQKDGWKAIHDTWNTDAK